MEVSQSLLMSVSHSGRNPQVEIQEYTDPDACEDLLALGIAAGRLSRFDEDHNIDRAAFERMFRALTVNSSSTVFPETFKVE